MLTFARSALVWVQLLALHEDFEQNFTTTAGRVYSDVTAAIAFSEPEAAAKAFQILSPVRESAKEEIGVERHARSS